MRRPVIVVEYRDIVVRGVWPYAPAAEEGARAGSPSLVKFLEFLLDRRGLQRKKPILDHDFLTFLTVDKLDEFFDDRIQRFIRSLVDIQIEMAPEWVGSIVRVLLVGFHIRHAVFLCYWNGAHIRGEIPNATVADAGLIFTHALDHGGRPRLFLDFVLVIPVLQRMFLEKSVGAGGRVPSIDTDGTVAQATVFHAGLFPQLNVLIVAQASAL